jgi:threonine dehydratase
MPLGTPEIKQTNVSRFSCSVVLHGADFSGAEQEAARLETLHGLVPISPFDPYVIAGQGTIGMELLRQSDPQSLTAVFCYFDVTSLHVIAGIGVYLKRVAPHVKIIGAEHCVGVEKKNAHTMVASLNANERVVLGEVGLFAGGSISRAGGETLRICREVVDEVIQVTNEEMCAAVKDMFEDTRSILDPAGAFALAGLTKWIRYNPSSNHERSLVAITSGADIEFSHLHFAAEPAVVA